ncbi:tail fiber assembly protein [Desulfocurvibacter africanus]|uniref:tail fiber assembly protein n=1 Tax=Desulfocurvibacter africanus TaxID=873 RepID=UPI0003F59A17|nr:tail fiber assembly protein [Desulfocurvibacter africanus]
MIIINSVKVKAQAVAAIRAERDRCLTASDRFVLPDYPHADTALLQAWLDYRQALRDLPEQAGFPWDGPDTAPWPEQPSLTPTQG